MEMSTSSSLVEEFYNKCHSKKNGKFCNTPGTGNVKDTPAAKAKAKASDAKNGVGPSAKKKVATASAPKKEAPKATPVKAKTTPKTKSATKPVSTKDKAQPKATTKKKVVSIPDTSAKSIKDLPTKAVSKSTKPKPKGEEEKKPSKTAAKADTTAPNVGTEAQRRKMFTQVVKDNGMDRDDPFMGDVAGFNIAPPPAGVQPSKLADYEIAAAVMYRSDGGYRRINSIMRDPKNRLDSSPVWDYVVMDLNQAIAAASPTTQEIVVKRALGGFKPPAGKAFTDKGFVSTTYGEIDSEFFSGKQIEIRIPKGTRVLKLSGDGSESKNETVGEAEILLPPGGRFVPTPDGSYVYEPKDVFLV